MKRVDSSPDSISALFPEEEPPPLIQTLPPAVTAGAAHRVTGLFDLRRRLTPQLAESDHQGCTLQPGMPLLIGTSVIIGVLQNAFGSEVLASQVTRAILAIVAALLLACACVRRGDGASTPPPAPAPPPPAPVPLQKRASGARHVLQINDGGAVLSMGDSSLMEEGEAWLGHLGQGVEWGDRVASPTPVSLPQKCEIVGVAAGSLHSLFLCSSGSIYSCGFGCEGPLGHGDEGSLSIPRPLASLNGAKGEKLA